jgi:hypothetical protein
MALAEGYQMVETLAADGPHPALRDRRRQLPSTSGSSNVEPAAATPSPNGIGTAGLLSETGRLRAPSLAHTKPARRTAVASPLAAGWRERNRRPEAGYASAGSGRWLENPLPGTAPVAAPLMA